MRSVLLIDDEPRVLGMLEKAFQQAGYHTVAAPRGEAGLAAYASDAADLVILDLNLPDGSGLEFLARFQALDSDVTVIMLTGQADLATAVEAMRGGAENFLSKPISLDHLYAAVDRAFEKIELRRRAGYLERRTQEEHGTDSPLGDSAAMRPVAEKVALVSPTDTTVLILGETGTGKSWIAQRIHGLSRRKAGPFVAVNCASLSATFLQSELFGHEKGAFTDARAMKRGLFELADKGTLFLDEIGDLGADLQPKLLTALESRRFRRLGGTRDIESDVRLIVATNRDLEAAVRDGHFREDLYYRIAVMPIVMPPLRKRARRDRERLVLDLLGDVHGFAGSHAASIAADALRLLADYHWPGNIREMRNVIERALILAGESRHVTAQHLPSELARVPDADSASAEPTTNLTLAELERRHIARVLAECGGNRSQAARILGISRVGLYKKLLREAEPPSDER